jgi:hypothetical protein
MSDEVNVVSEIPVCSICRRERTLTGMDAYDYSPVQAITGAPLGWYSADDGEICPEDMTQMLRRANG